MPRNQQSNTDLYFSLLTNFRHVSLNAIRILRLIRSDYRPCWPDLTIAYDWLSQNLRSVQQTSLMERSRILINLTFAKISLISSMCHVGFST